MVKCLNAGEKRTTRGIRLSLSELKEALAPHIFLTEEQGADLELYAAQLEKWQRAYNLVAPNTLPSLWTRHFLDSAQLLHHIPEDARTFVDLGSGGGFPGLVLAALLKNREAAHFHFIESAGKKCTFLRDTARRIGAPVTVHHCRIEQVEPIEADVITARALASLEKLLTYAHRFSTETTRMIFPKGQDFVTELTEATKYWIIQPVEVQSLSDDSGTILLIDGAKAL